MKRRTQVYIFYTIIAILAAVESYTFYPYSRLLSIFCGFGSLFFIAAIILTIIEHPLEN